MKTTKFMISMLTVLLLVTGCAQSPELVDSSSGVKKTPLLTLESGVQEIGGVVLGGGDQTEKGLMDAPRTFVYQVQLESGEQINLTYTAYPPSPAGKRSPILLKFFEGVINPGNYIRARGTYDAENRTLTVAVDGDFIETFAEKP
jgi:hypothetical protein